MMQDLLFEIGCEELPPKAMPNLAQALLNGIEQGLSTAGLISNESAGQWFAAPRRLVVLLRNVTTQQAEQSIERRGPAVNVAYDAEGNPSKALQGFARSCGVDVEQLGKVATDKGEWFYYKATKPGATAVELLPNIIKAAIKKLPIPKAMRWGANATEFIRPVHWILLLLGNDVVPMEILGKTSDRLTYGHRFMAPGALSVASPDDYLATLETQGKVIADFAARREIIAKGIASKALEVGGEAIVSPELLDEVTAIVEWPEVLRADFSKDFLAVPKEALICAMEGHQKCFAMLDVTQNMMPHFIFVANIKSKQPEQVIRGNEKVMRARLSDAAFFYQTDLKATLQSHLQPLQEVKFQKLLGSMFDRTRRVTALAVFIAGQIGADVALVERAAHLAKCDLLTNMVNEFPELQGVMGRAYGAHDGEDPIVCEAIEQHYWPTCAGGKLPENLVAVSIALADKIDLISSIFSIGQKPTGDKDPFGLRRAAIGVVRILMEHQLPLELPAVLAQAMMPYSSAADEVRYYLLERLKYHYLEQGVSAQLFASVAEVQPKSLTEFAARLSAVQAFMKLPAAESLAAANKRVKNILRKQAEQDISGEVKSKLLVEPAEQALFAEITTQQDKLASLLSQADYQACLESLAQLREPVDQFFADVMVMSEEAKLQQNRLCLLQQLRALFLSVADISQLS
jgi:glycyl-tRNA synthetase beta chain